MNTMQSLINGLELAVSMGEIELAMRHLDAARELVAEEDKETRVILHDYGNTIQKMIFAKYFQNKGSID